MSFSEEEAEKLQDIQRIDETIFLAIQIVGGHVLLPILVLTIIFSRKVVRNPIFVNFCISWIFSSILYSLLVYKGRSNTDLTLNPTYDACLIQASLLNGAQALTACTSFSLVFHLWMLLRSCIPSGDETPLFKKECYEKLYTWAHIMGPFVIFVVFSVYSLVAGGPRAIDSTGKLIPNSNLSIPGAFYCIILQNADFSITIRPGLKLLEAVYLFAIIVTVITLCFECAIVIMVYKKRSYLSKNWPVLLIRVITFSVYRTIALGFNIACIIYPDELLLGGISRFKLYNGPIDYIQAAIPLVAFVIFASEKDVIRAWCFWRKDEER